MKTALIAAVVVAPAIAVPFFWEKFQAQQDSAKRVDCNEQLFGLGLYLREYCQEHGHLPPAFVRGPDGKPWHSWRVLLLPYIGKDDLHKEYRFDEPWDGPNNRKLAARMPKIYGCPGDKEAREQGRTNYFAVVGPGTAFPGVTPRKLSEITRPHRETILLIESTGRDINWMEPRDIALSELSLELNDPQFPSISSKHRYPQALMVDGSRTLMGLKGDVKPFDLRKMLLAQADLIE